MQTRDESSLDRVKRIFSVDVQTWLWPSFCLEKLKQKWGFSLGWREQWVWITARALTGCSSLPYFLSWLITIQKALHVKLLNTLCIYDASLSLSRVCALQRDTECWTSIHSPLANILPYIYWTIFFPNSVSVSPGSPPPTDEGRISSLSLAIMDHRSRLAVSRRVCWEKMQLFEINDERWFTAHLKK